MAAGARSVVIAVLDITISGHRRRPAGMREGGGRRSTTAIAPAEARIYTVRPVALPARPGLPPRECLPALDGAAQRHLVGELQVAPVGDAAGDAGDPGAQGAELPGDEEGGGLAVDGGRGGDQDLRDLIASDPL